MLIRATPIELSATRERGIELPEKIELPEDVSRHKRQVELLVKQESQSVTPGKHIELMSVRTDQPVASH